MHLDKGVTRTDAPKGILDDEKVNNPHENHCFSRRHHTTTTCTCCDDIDNYYDNAVAADGGDEVAHDI